MTWFDYFLIAWLTFGAFLTIAQTGKPRTTIEPLAAAISTLITALLVVGILWSGGAL